MKKKVLFFNLILFQTIVFSQTRAEKDNLRFVEKFYEHLKKLDISVKEPLFWKYTYRDTTLATLTNLSKALQQEGVKTIFLDKSKDEKQKGKYELTVYEKKTYKNPKQLNERLLYLNSIATTFNITDKLASVDAIKSDKTTYVEKYK